MTEDLNQEHISQDLLVVSTNDIDGVEIVDYVGIVQGSTVRSRNVGSDIFANLKNLVGGELVGYSKLLQTSRDQAYQRMLDDAKAKGANAVVCFRFQTSTITQGASEILAYGTGVIIKK